MIQYINMDMYDKEQCHKLGEVACASVIRIISSGSKERQLANKSFAYVVKMERLNRPEDGEYYIRLMIKYGDNTIQHPKTSTVPFYIDHSDFVAGRLSKVF